MIPRQLSHSAFSLIELLVVFAVIAILASLLTASLRKIVSQSNSLACLNNLKQINQSSHLYQDDFDGMMLRQLSKSYGSNRSYFWSQMILHLGYVKSELTDDNFETVHNCAERVTKPRRDRTPWGYNLRIANWWSSNPDMRFRTLHSSDLSNPSNTFLFVESIVKGGQEDWGFFMINKGWYPNFHGFNPLHLSYGNVSFADGRVEPISELDYVNMVAQPNSSNPWLP